jgi:hypothetical protein
MRDELNILYYKIVYSDGLFILQMSFKNNPSPTVYYSICTSKKLDVVLSRWVYDICENIYDFKCKTEYF